MRYEASYPGGSLARTGSESLVLGQIALALVLAGAALVTAGRRRRRRPGG